MLEYCSQTRREKLRGFIYLEMKLENFDFWSLRFTAAIAVLWCERYGCFVETMYVWDFRVNECVWIKTEILFIEGKKGITAEIKVITEVRGLISFDWSMTNDQWRQWTNSTKFITYLNYSNFSRLFHFMENSCHSFLATGVCITTQVCSYLQSTQ